MNEVAQIILDTLAANGGVMSWDTMLAAVPESGRRFIWEALAYLKSEDQAQAQNRFSPEEGAVFEIVQLGG